MPEKEKFLGEFEHILLLALLRLGEESYGAKVRKLLMELIERDVSIGALYATLERLEKKGLVESYLGESTPERGGRAKRFFKVTVEGKSALQRSKNAIEVMWQGVALNCSVS